MSMLELIGVPGGGRMRAGIFHIVGSLISLRSKHRTYSASGIGVEIFARKPPILVQHNFDLNNVSLCTRVCGLCDFDAKCSRQTC